MQGKDNPAAEEKEGKIIIRPLLFQAWFYALIYSMQKSTYAPPRICALIRYVQGYILCISIIPLHLLEIIFPRENF